MAIAELDARREALRALRCRTGHALELVSCDIGTQLCDRCQRRIDCSFTYRCRSSPLGIRAIAVSKFQQQSPLHHGSSHA
eukprot:s1442_g8.t1